MYEFFPKCFPEGQLQKWEVTLNPRVSGDFGANSTAGAELNKFSLPVLILVFRLLNDSVDEFVLATALPFRITKFRASSLSCFAASLSISTPSRSNLLLWANNVNC